MKSGVGECGWIVAILYLPILSLSIAYLQLYQLEGVDSHLFIIDIEGSSAIKRIIKVYRSFNPQNNINARLKFKYQLELIKNAMTDKCVVIGDFNLNYDKIHDDNYNHKYLFEDFEDAFSTFNFVTLKSNKLKVGINSLTNRFYYINNAIPLNWLNLSIESFKIKCKKTFLASHL